MGTQWGWIVRPKTKSYFFYFPHLVSMSSSQHEVCRELCKNSTPSLMQTTWSHHIHLCYSFWWGHSHWVESVVMHSFCNCAFCDQCTFTLAHFTMELQHEELYREGVVLEVNDGLYNALAHCVMSEPTLGVLTLNFDLHGLSEEVDSLSMAYSCSAT